MNEQVNLIGWPPHGFQVMTLTAIVAAFTTAGMGSSVLALIYNYQEL